jgi:hypothetical protein
MVARFILILLVIPVLTHQADAKAWRGIVPLHSSKTDVERRFGKPLSQDRDGIHYDFDNEYVVFALARPGGTEDCAHKLPPDTVIRIAVIPKRPSPLTSFEPRKQKLTFFDPLEFQPPDFPIYVNQEQGIILRTYQGNVDRIVYIAERKDQNLCSSYYQDSTLMVSRILCMLCPTIAVTCPDNVEAGTQVNFTVNSVMGNLRVPLTFKWTVSGGTIVEGQGTDFITVVSNNLEEKTVQATVEVGGIDSACDNKASSATEIVPRRKNP